MTTGTRGCVIRISCSQVCTRSGLIAMLMTSSTFWQISPRSHPICRSCTALAANASSMNGPLTICLVTNTHVPSASGTPLGTSASMTFGECYSIQPPFMFVAGTTSTSADGPCSSTR